MPTKSIKQRGLKPTASILFVVRQAQVLPKRDELATDKTQIKHGQKPQILEG
jgi:hypothetical protein